MPIAGEDRKEDNLERLQEERTRGGKKRPSALLEHERKRRIAQSPTGVIGAASLRNDEEEQKRSQGSHAAPALATENYSRVRTSSERRIRCPGVKGRDVQSKAAREYGGGRGPKEAGGRQKKREKGQPWGGLKGSIGFPVQRGELPK